MSDDGTPLTPRDDGATQDCASSLDKLVFASIVPHDAEGPIIENGVD